MSTLRWRVSRGVVTLLVLLPACGGGVKQLDLAAGTTSTGLPATEDASPETSGAGPSTTAPAPAPDPASSSSSNSSAAGTPAPGQPRTTRRPASATPDQPTPTVRVGITTMAKPRPKIERPSGTPRGTVFPPNDSAYRWLATGSCEQLLGRVDTRWQDEAQGVVNETLLLLYKAAAEACLQRWDAARRDYEKLLQEKPVFDVSDPGDCEVTEAAAECEACLRAVFLWLTAVLEAHRREPDLQPVFVTGRGASPCPKDDSSPEPTPSP